MPREPFPVRLGRRVRAERIARGLTQADLAGPYSRAFVALLEAGGVAPSARALETIAVRLGVDPSSLGVSSHGPAPRTRPLVEGTEEPEITPATAAVKLHMRVGSRLASR